MMLSGLTDRLGLENNEAGWLIGWVMECFEKGWLTADQTGGFEIGWGDVGGVKKLLHASKALKVAVSPFVNRRAVSGPAKELMEAKGLEGSSSGLARFYARTIDLLFIHHSDRAESGTIEHQGVTPVPCQTIMKGLQGSVDLAGRILETCWEAAEKKA